MVIGESLEASGPANLACATSKKKKEVLSQTHGRQGLSPKIILRSARAHMNAHAYPETHIYINTHTQISFKSRQSSMLPVK